MRLFAQMAGYDRLSLRVKYLSRAAERGLLSGTAEGALLFETAAKENAPVVSGDLKKSITTTHTLNTPEKQERMIEPKVPYGRRIEMGFVGADSLGRVYNQPPRPYMRPAFDVNEAEAKATIVDHIREELHSATNEVAARRNRR